ncbi:hypothetical protein [Streptomyces sp. NBC_01089]|uniref:hypothetical protein n=1 Tax=Streptomyces sp. NBC_01089 TaxID=2903747 RepID=UPI0038668356|nr:hypothetical protein OG510_20265 [Streptomyces sp. NBC_01089]
MITSDLTGRKRTLTSTSTSTGTGDYRLKPRLLHAVLSGYQQQRGTGSDEGSVSGRTG